MTQNERAFLAMLAYSEGTDNGRQRTLFKGYDVIVGGNLLFLSYADHPRQVVRLSDTLSSSAAGRYQILARYFDAYKKLLHLPDFSPNSQDAIALQMISEQKALPDINAGRLDAAVKKCANIWASLPGAGYNQHENKIAYLRSAFVMAGGKIEVV